MKNKQELQQKRAKLITDAKAIIAGAEAGKRDLNEDEQKQVDGWLADSDKLRDEIAEVDKRDDRLRKIETTEAEFRQVTGTDDKAVERTGDERVLEQSDQEKEQRANWGKYVKGEVRALEAGSDAAGGFTVAPQQISTELLRNVDDENFVRGLARKFTVTDAESLGVPQLTKPAAAQWTSELAIGSEDSTMAFKKRELRPHPLAAFIKVSTKLIRQAMIDPVGLVNREFATVFGTGEEIGYMTGNGNLKPLGVFTASGNGISTGRDVSTDNSTTEVTSDNLIRCKFTLKAQYWQGANWVMHRDVLSLIARLKDGQGLPLFNVDRNTLLGFPIKVSENAPNTFTAAQYMAILGNFNRGYWIVDALTFRLQRLDELYAAANQTGFIGRLETDGAPVIEEAFVRSILAP